MSSNILNKSVQWYVYILRCADNSLYTGITTDINRREKEHNSTTATAAKYTRARRPVKMVYQENADDRASATKREMAIKKLSKTQKEKLLGAAQQRKFKAV